MSPVLCSVQFFVTPWTAACLASLFFTIFQSLFKLMSIKSAMPSNHLILCNPLLLLLSVFPSIRVFSNGQSMEASTSAPVLPMIIQDWFPSGLTGFISFLSKGLSKVSYNITVQKRQFFGTQPSLWSNSHPYMTTGKTIAFTIQNFVCKVMSLLFNILCRFVIAFFTRSKCVLIS